MGSQPDTLRYAVPEAQDPAVVLTALAEHDIDAEPEEAGGESYVVVPRPGGVTDTAAWREKVRAVISTADPSIFDRPDVPGPVRFTDEQQG